MAIEIGDGAFAATCIEHGSTDEGLSGGLVGDGATDCYALGLRRQDKRKQQNGQEQYYTLSHNRYITQKIFVIVCRASVLPSTPAADDDNRALSPQAARAQNGAGAYVDGESADRECL